MTEALHVWPTFWESPSDGGFHYLVHITGFPQVSGQIRDFITNTNQQMVCMKNSTILHEYIKFFALINKPLHMHHWYVKAIIVVVFLWYYFVHPLLSPIWTSLHEFLVTFSNKWTWPLVVYGDQFCIILREECAKNDIRGKRWWPSPLSGSCDRWCTYRSLWI